MKWLTTNGLGGYASGTVCGANTRSYHGLLVAALETPERRWRGARAATYLPLILSAERIITMLEFLLRMRIRRRLFLGFGCLLLLAMMIGLGALARMDR